MFDSWRQSWRITSAVAQFINFRNVVFVQEAVVIILVVSFTVLVY